RAESEADLATGETPDLATADPADLATVVTPPDFALQPTTPTDLSTPPDLAMPVGCSAAEHIVINEIKVGASTLRDEFIELYNPCAHEVSLTNWTLSHYSAQGTSESPVATIKLTAPIPGNGYVLIASDACGCKSFADQIYNSAAFSADGGGLGLRNA